MSFCSYLRGRLFSVRFFFAFWRPGFLAKTPDPPDKFSVEFAEASGLGLVS